MTTTSKEDVAVPDVVQDASQESQDNLYLYKVNEDKLFDENRTYVSFIPFSVR